jgi:hypothetical protein
MRAPHGKPDHSVTHRRRVVFLRDAGFWLMEDQLAQTDDTPHTFSQVWNFPPKRESTKDYAREQIDGFARDEFRLQPDEKRFATADPSGPNLEFMHVTPGPVRYREFYGDEKELKGWFAPGLGSLRAAPDVYAEWNSADCDRLVTLLLPQPKDGTSPVTRIERLSGPGWFGFDAQLQTGGTLRYRTAQAPTPLQIDAVTAAATSLLVRERNGQISGIVTGAADLTIAGRAFALADPCAEFVQRNGRVRITPIPLQRSPRIAEPPPFLASEAMPPLTIAGEEGFQIRYTLDGTDPAANSLLYTGPVSLAEPATVKARYFHGTEALPFVTAKEFRPSNRTPRPADYPLAFPAKSGVRCGVIRNKPESSRRRRISVSSRPA